MDFDDMKMIWDTQNDAPLYAIDEAALHANVRRKARGFKRIVLSFEFLMTGTALFLVVLFLRDPILHGASYDQVLSAALILGAAAYFFVGIWRRKRGETAFPATLLGDLDRALWQVEYHMARSRAIRWSFIVPMCLALTIDALIPFEGQVLFTLLLPFYIFMGAAAWGVEYEIRCWYLPKHRKLTALRELLTK